MISTLGQSGVLAEGLAVVLAESSIGSMLFWVVLLIAVVIVGGVLAMTVRQKMLELDDSSSVGASGLLDHLHELHRSGKMSDEEFASARTAILNSVQDEIQDRQEEKSRGEKPDLSEFEEFL